MTPLAADRAEIARYVTTIYVDADEGSYVNLRTFEHERGKPPVEIRAVRINGEGLDPIIAQATGMANRAARRSKPTVFAPIPCTFKDDRKAELGNVLNGLALFVDVDEANPRKARERLEGLLGPAGIVVTSGSAWVDPATGEVQDRLHLYWPLAEPTRTPEEHARLNRAIKIMAALVGGDPSMTLVHPLRWPGGWNRKGEPRLARGRYTDAKVHLDDALEILEGAAKLALEHATGEEADRLRLSLELRGQWREAPEHDPDARDPDLEALADAIPNRGPNGGVPNGEYRNIGLGFYAASDGSAAGLNAWTRWAGKSTKFHGGTYKVWREFSRSPPDRTGKASLIARAQRADPTFRLPSWGHGPDPDGKAIADRLLAHRETQESHGGEAEPVGSDPGNEDGQGADDATRDEIDRIVAEAPGGLGRMTSWMVRTAVSPQPWLSLGAALCCYGAVIGRKYFIEYPADTRPVIYVIAVAESGSGKDHPRVCVKEAMDAADLSDLLGGENFASGAAVTTAMSVHPSRVFLIDEIGQHIKTMMDERQTSPHRREIITQLTTFWSSGAGVVRGAEYANQKERPRIDIRQPNLCLYGSTVATTFWEGLRSGNMGDGSLARFLIFATPRNFPDDQKPELRPVGLDEIAEDLKTVAEGAEGWEYGDLAFTAVTSATPYPVPLTPEAEAYDEELRRRQLAMKRKHEGSQYGSIVARYREQVMRVALVAAVADDPKQPEVGAKHLA